MPVYDDGKNAGVIAFVTDIRDRIDIAFDYLVADADLTNAEIAKGMLELHNQYDRNNTLMTEMTRLYQPAANEPPPEP